ncbi:MAG: formylglycine-generating enzyme family protein [Pyrinomonadaceae bacterium]
MTAWITVVLIVACGAVASSQITAPQAKRPLPVTLRDVGGPEMILIPAGEFFLGSTQEDVDWVTKTTGVERWGDTVRKETRRTVKLPAFYIGKYEVTNQEYKEFVVTTGHRNPGIEGLSTGYDWENGSYPSNLATHPVVLISRVDAEQYCQWLSKRTGKRYRLPTDEEWEKAASWDEVNKVKRRYPWGNEYNAGRGLGEPTAQQILNKVLTMPVGSVTFDQSAYGVYDMGENVAEWVTAKGTVTLKGGNNVEDAKSAILYSRCAHSWGYSPDDDGRHVWRGFRVAREP